MYSGSGYRKRSADRPLHLLPSAYPQVYNDVPYVMTDINLFLCRTAFSVLSFFRMCVSVEL